MHNRMPKNKFLQDLIPTCINIYRYPWPTRHRADGRLEHCYFSGMQLKAQKQKFTISAESIPSDFTPASKKDRRSTQFRIKGSFSSNESSISTNGLVSFVALKAPLGPIWRKNFKREGAYLVPAVESTPKSPRIDNGGRAIAAADNGSTASYKVCKVMHRYRTSNLLNKICISQHALTDI